MSTLAFSAGMAAPLVYLSFSFYDRYGFSKKLCNAFCAASCIAAALTALLSIVLKLSVEGFEIIANRIHGGEIAQISPIIKRVTSNFYGISLIGFYAAQRIKIGRAHV